VSSISCQTRVVGHGPGEGYQSVPAGWDWKDGLNLDICGSALWFHVMELPFLASVRQKK